MTSLIPLSIKPYSCCASSSPFFSGELLTATSSCLPSTTTPHCERRGPCTWHTATLRRLHEYSAHSFTPQSFLTVPHPLSGPLWFHLDPLEIDLRFISANPQQLSHPNLFAQLPAPPLAIRPSRHRKAHAQTLLGPQGCHLVGSRSGSASSLSQPPSEVIHDYRNYTTTKSGSRGPSSLVSPRRRINISLVPIVCLTTEPVFGHVIHVGQFGILGLVLKLLTLVHACTAHAKLLPGPGGEPYTTTETGRAGSRACCGGRHGVHRRRVGVGG